MTLPDNSFLPAVVVPPHMKQGDTFRYAFRVRDRNLDGTPGDPVDLTGVTVRSQMRATPQDAVAVIDFDAAVAVDQVTRATRVIREIRAIRVSKESRVSRVTKAFRVSRVFRASKV
jgi:hypothetical protein